MMKSTNLQSCKNTVSKKERQRFYFENTGYPRTTSTLRLTIIIIKIIIMV